MFGINEWIRTDEGVIEKVWSIEDNKWLIDRNGNYWEISEVVKHNKDILKIIRPGDYVNGCKVYAIRDNSVLVILETKVSTERSYIQKRDIRWVVSKEYMEKGMVEI